MKRKYNYNSETGVAHIILIEGDNEFHGFASCHEDDEDFQSERIGMTIAEARAEINFLQHIRDNELMPAIKALRHVYGNMKTSKYFNLHSYEARMIRRQIRIKENDLIVVKQEINSRKQFITDYIKQKDELHDRLRKAKKN
jgi:hypothetical protein